MNVSSNNRVIRIDKSNDRLVYITCKADQDYWNSVHAPFATKAHIERGDRFVSSETAKYLAPGAKVVDAGCGAGATVYGLNRTGFDAYGIDYDTDTVATINSLFPHLKVQVADVRNMPFEDDFLDGVWSLGVIEHFYDGYDPIVAEAKRVLRPGGYLFLTVPSISPLNRMKMFFGQYRQVDESELDNFFQFAFHPKDTVSSVSRHGFELVKSSGRSGSLGFYEDARLLSRFFFLNPNYRSILPRMIWRGADIVFRSFSYHVRYFVFKNNG